MSHHDLPAAQAAAEEKAVSTHASWTQGAGVSEPRRQAVLAPIGSIHHSRHDSYASDEQRMGSARPSYQKLSQRHRLLTEAQNTSFSSSMRAALMGDDAGSEATVPADDAGSSRVIDVHPQHGPLLQPAPLAASQRADPSARRLHAALSTVQAEGANSAADMSALWNSAQPEADTGSGMAGSGFVVDGAAAGDGEGEFKHAPRRRSKRPSEAARLCVVCQDQPSVHFNLPCGHRCVCAACFENEKQAGDMYCPVCMQLVEEFLHEDDPELSNYFKNNEDWAELRDNSTFQQKLDDEWEQHLDPESSEMFYYNVKTHVTQWEYPLDKDTAKRGFTADLYNYEGLGPNFADTAWVPPKESIAYAYRTKAMFHGGSAPICHVGTEELAALGTGITLYFRFLKYLVVVFSVMTVVSLPVMEICRQGSRMPDRVPDPFGVSLLSLGNVGDPTRSRFVQDNASQSVFSTSNETAADVWGWQLTSVGASYLISFCDFIYTWVFIVFLWWLRSRIHFVEHHNRKHVRASDYTVYVRAGLPKDATEAGIREHFSGLFSLVEAEREAMRKQLLQLSKRKGKITPTASAPRAKSGKTRPVTLGKIGRAKSTRAAEFGASSKAFVDESVLVVYTQPGDLPLEGAGAAAWQGRAAKEALLKPVEDISHNNHEAYFGSWVADVHIVRPNGANIRTFLRVQALTERLRNARAKAKMYAELTPHSLGPQPDRHAKAMKHVEQLEFQMADVRTKMEAHSENVDDVCIGAFVTFNHEESFLRCAQAYDKSRSVIRRIFQPKELRFRGRSRLRVDPAPNPSDVLWENLGVTSCGGFFRRQITGFVTFLLVLMSFLVILSAHSAQQRFLKQVPDLAMCETELPTLFLGSEQAFQYASGNTTDAIQRVRPGLFDRGAMDAKCPSGSFYSTYAGAPGVPFDADNCAASYAAAAKGAFEDDGGPVVGTTDVQCPDPRRATQCPCLNPNSVGTCFSMECYKPELATEQTPCREFSASTVVGCYCLRRLEGFIEERGAIAGGQDFLDQEGDLCGTWAENFFLAQVFTGLAAGCVAIVNVLLKIILTRLVLFERHHSVTRESGAVAVKIFISQFVNTGIVVLFVHGKLPNNINNPVASLGVFGGKHDDFTAEWYGNVGSLLCLTMVANIFTPHFEHFFGWCLQKRSRKKAGTEGGFLTQASMNKAFVGPRFDLSERYAQVLMVVCVTLLYCGGIPLLLPLCALSLWVHYGVDKILILRYHAKPPNYGSYLNHLMLWFLPWALVGHVAFSAWMYGNNDILESKVINPSIIDGWTPGSAEDSEQLYEDWFQRAIEADGIGAGAKVVRINVFPHVLLLGGLLCVTVLWRILGPYVRPLWFRVSNGHWKTTFKRQRKYIAPYTAEFAKLLSDDGKSSSAQTDDAAVVASALKYAVSPKVSKDKGGDDTKDGGATTNATGRLSARILSKLELSQGWRVQKRGDVLVLQKQWMDSRKVHGGKWHEYGQLKRTWEVIADADAPSYDILANPKYREAFRAQIEQAWADTSSDEDGDDSSDSSDDGETVVSRITDATGEPAGPQVVVDPMTCDSAPPPPPAEASAAQTG